MKPLRQPSRLAFTLIELLVVITIIAVLAALIFPVFGMVRKRSVETRTVSNMKQIGTGMGSYIAEHDDTMPGPLTVEQYPTFDKDEKKNKGSLAYLLAPYLGLKPKISEENVTKETDLFACVGATGPKLDEVPGYIMNMQKLPDYDQPAWGDANGDSEPMRRSTLTSWRDLSPDAPTKESTVVLSRKWAMRHTDQKDAEKLVLSGDWVEKLPKDPVFDDRYQALFFDLHVESFRPKYDNRD